MSFKKEVRDFIASQRYKDDAIKLLQKEMDKLRKQNEKLLDRLMARSFQELKVYESPVEYNQVVDEIEPEEDYQNAGEIL